MEIDKIDSECQIIEITELIGHIFPSCRNDIVVKIRGECYDIEYRYGDYLIKVSKEYENRYQYYYVEIEIINTQESINEPTPFWQLLAYYDNEKYNMSYRKENIDRYLKKLKEYLDGNRYFYEATDIMYRKRYFVFEGKRKEMPYIINLDTEDKLRFGDNCVRISKNKPILEPKGD